MVTIISESCFLLYHLFCFYVMETFQRINYTVGSDLHDLYLIGKSLLIEALS